MTGNLSEGWTGGFRQGRGGQGGLDRGEVDRGVDTGGVNSRVFDLRSISVKK